MKNKGVSDRFIYFAMAVFSSRMYESAHIPWLCIDIDDDDDDDDD